MLDKLLEFFIGRQLPQDVSERLYIVARDFLAKLIDRLLEKDQAKLRDQISGGAH